MKLKRTIFPARKRGPVQTIRDCPIGGTSAGDAVGALAMIEAKGNGTSDRSGKGATKGGTLLRYWLPLNRRTDRSAAPVSRRRVSALWERFGE